MLTSRGKGGTPSPLVADGLEGSAQCVRITRHGQRLRQSAMARRSYEAGGDQRVDRGGAHRRWTQFRDWLVAVSDGESFPLFHPPKVGTQVLSQLGNAHGGVHVHEGSISTVRHAGSRYWGSCRHTKGNHAGVVRRRLSSCLAVLPKPWADTRAAAADRRRCGCSPSRARRRGTRRRSGSDRCFR